MQGRFLLSGCLRLTRLALWTGAVWLSLSAGAWAAAPTGRAGAPSAPPPQVPTIPPDLIQPSGPRPVVPGGTGRGLKMGPAPSEEVNTVQKERCERASYIVRQANELGDESPLTISYVQRALDICPNNPPANVRMGIIQFNQKNLEGARKAFRQALRDGAHLPEVHYNLGILSRKEKKDAEALTHFRRAVELEPGNSQALYNLGVLQARAQERAQAIESFRKAIKANPKMAEAHFFLGALLQEQGQRDDARVELQESVKLNPRLSLPHIYLAAILEAEGKSQAAQDELNRAVRLNPASVQVGYSLDDFYTKEGGANRFLSRIQERSPNETASAVASPAAGKAPPGGGAKASQDFGPRREAREVPVAGKKPPPREKASAPRPRQEAASAPRRAPSRPAPPARRKEPPGRTYRVRPGDSLSAIAARHGTTLEVLARLNRDRVEHPSLIEPGQELLLPSRPRAARTRRPQAKSAASRSPSRAANRQATAPRGSFRIHRVRRGETLARIARRYGTTVATLMRLNRERIEHPSMIQVGQSIRVPAPRAARKAPAPKPAAKAPAPARQEASPRSAPAGEPPKAPAPAPAAQPAAPPR